MSRHDTEDKISAAVLAGYTTELTVWRFVHDMAQTFVGRSKEKGNREKGCGFRCLEDVLIEGKQFKLQTTDCSSQSADDIWNLGACVYRLLMGGEPFGGRGREGQTPQSPLPRFNETDYSKELSDVVAQCLAYDAASRPSAEALLKKADEMSTKLRTYVSDKSNLSAKSPINRKRRQSTYSFWPETMIVFILALFCSLPITVHAQTDVEMEKLMNVVTMMRDQSNRSKALSILKNDSLWTLMDELTRNTNECSFADEVNMFGVNDIALEIANSRKPILNSGSSFKNSADGIHKYSFIELTAKAMRKITFCVEGHKGVQQVVIIPFNTKQKYAASITHKGKKITSSSTAEGVSSFTFRLGNAAHTDYWFEISNQGTKNASYVVITYNSGK